MSKGTPKHEPVKLTMDFLNRVKAPLEGYDYWWDRSVRGYGIRCAPTGKKVFVVQGRVKGKPVIFSIGPFGTYSESQARQKAQKVLQDMRDGIDPRDVRRADEAASVTLRAVADAYVDRPSKLKESSKREINRHVDTVFAAWKEKPIAAITEADCLKRYREMATKGLRGKGPAPGQANLSFTTLRALINFAMRQYKRTDGSPIIRHNPVGVLKDEWIQLQPRTRDIETKDVGAVWLKLSEMRADPKNRDALAGIDLTMFCLLTGTRRMEGATLEWKNVNLEEAWFHLPDPKNRNPVWLPLSSQAVKLLKRRQPAESDKTASTYVFPSRSRAGHIMDTRAPLEAVSKVVKHPLSCHDLRRTNVSVGVAVCGIDLYKMELLTNHVPKGVTARHYLKTSRLQYLLPEVQRIGDWIEEQGRIAAAKASATNVVQLAA
jgi:integrase